MGCGDFGKAWDRNLTDEDGPYIELMTGVYTENQPDFTWLKPFEEKTFKQYFMPYKKVGAVKNATIYAAVNAEITEEKIVLTVYATSEYRDAEIVVTRDSEVIFKDETVLSPIDVYEKTVLEESKYPEEIRVSVYGGGKLLVEYQPEKASISKLADPAEPALDPEKIRTNEELLLTAQHIEQHRHATYQPDPYYLEGLKRDPKDIRINNAYGMLLLRRGEFAYAEKHFRTAIERMTWRSPNPYNSESYYNLGLALLWQNKEKEAFDAFYKATWSSEQQEMSYYYLAVIKTREKEYKEAMELAEKGLVKNIHNVKARGLKAFLLRMLGQETTAQQWIRENLQLDPFDYMSRYEQWMIKKEDSLLNELNTLMRNSPENYLKTARQYGEFGAFEEALGILSECTVGYPLISYYRGYYSGMCGEQEACVNYYRIAEKQCPDCCFPNKLEDIEVLEDAGVKNPKGAKSYYYLGNLFYDKLRFKRAEKLWEKSVELDSEYPTVHRNLALACYNKENDPERAKVELEKAFELDSTDSRVFLELDQLYKKMGTAFGIRLERFEKNRQILSERDDIMLEYVTLCNQMGEYQKAYEIIMSHTFRPWEGAEGRISGQYKIALIELAKAAIKNEQPEKAVELLEKSLEYPLNLGEGRLEGTKDNHIHYYLGEAKEDLGDMEAARREYEKAQAGDNEPAGVLYYYDQPADMILYKGLASEKLGDHKTACACFNKLMDYGERHLRDKMKNDFFAVSLPDFLIFEDNMDDKNRAHCYYLMGLSALGYGRKEEAEKYFLKALEIDFNHQNCRIYLNMCK